MTPNRKLLLAGGLALAVGTALGAGHALARTGQPSHHPGGHRPLARLLHKSLANLFDLRADLDLTDDQRSRIHAALAPRRGEIATAIQPMVEARRGLRQAVLASPADPERIRQAAARLGQAMGDAAVVAASVAAELRPLLTPEQQQRLEEHRGHRDAAIDRFLSEISQGEPGEP